VAGHQPFRKPPAGPRLCDAELQGDYELEVIDIYQQPIIARDGQILATPTLVREFRGRCAGSRDLSDTRGISSRWIWRQRRDRGMIRGHGSMVNGYVDERLMVRTDGLLRTFLRVLAWPHLFSQRPIPPIFEPTLNREAKAHDRAALACASRRRRRCSTPSVVDMWMRW